MSHLGELVISKISALGNKDASEFFGVNETVVKGWFAGTRVIPLTAIEKVFDPTSIPVAPKLQEAMWEGKKVAIALPWYKQTNPVTAFCVMGLIDRMKTAVMLNFGDAFIVHTRNTLAQQFLDTSIEWMLTVDDDMVIPWGNSIWYNAFTGFNLQEKFAGMHTLNRLMSHNKTLVGGLYFGRWKSGKPVYAEGASSEKEASFARLAPHDLVNPTRWVGTGCMLIHRAVFLDIEKTFSHLARKADGKGGQWFTSSEHDLRKASELVLMVLSDISTSETARIAQAQELLTKATLMSGGNSPLGIGEDVQFCLRASASGHQPHVDLGLLCGHMGSYIYGAKFP